MLVKLGVDTSDLNAGMDRATRAVNKFGQDVESAGRRLSLGLTLPLGALGLAAVKTAGEMEQTKVAFTTLMKSADEAGKHLDELKRFALVTPFQFQDLTKASRLMQAYGFAAQDVVPKLRTIGNAVSALGGGSELLERVVRSMGEIGTRGKITGEQLRELSRAGIPALDAIAKKLGVSVAEAQKQITAGNVDAKTAMDGLLEYMNTRFAGGMEAQSKTVLGSWSNIKDKITFTLADIGNALLPIAKRVMNEFLDPMLERVKALAEGFGRLPAPIQSVGLALTGMAAVVPLLTVAIGSTITNAIAIAGAFSKIVTVTTPLVKLLGGASGLAALVAVAGVAGYKAGEYLQNKFGSGVDAATESVKRLNAEVGRSVLVKAASHDGGAANTGGLGKWIIDSALQATDAMKKTAGSIVDIDKMLTDAGMATMAERRKNLDEAKALYAAVVKEYGAGSVIAIQALQKVNDAQAQLIPTLKEVKNHAQGLFQFGSKGVESGIIVEQIRQQEAELQKWISAVAKVGGLTKYNAQEADKLSEAFKLLGEAPVMGVNRLTDAEHRLLDASLPIDPQIAKINEALKAFGLEGEKANIDGLSKKFETLGEAFEKGIVSFNQYIRAWIEYIKAADKAGEYIDPATKREVIELEKTFGGQLGQTRKEMSALGREAERFYHAVSRGIASSIVNFKGWGETFKNIAKDTAQSLLTIFVEAFFKKMAKELAGLLANSKGVLGSIGKWLGGLAGTGGSAASAAGGAASAAGSAGSAGAGAAGSAASGVMGTIGAVSAAVGAVSSIVGNFQMAGMNKSLDVLVNHTLRIFNVVYQMLDEHYLFKGQLFAKMDDMWRTNLNIYDLLGRGGGTGGSGKGGLTFNNCSFNGTPQQNAAAIFQYADLAGAL